MFDGIFQLSVSLKGGYAALETRISGIFDPHPSPLYKHIYSTKLLISGLPSQPSSTNGLGTKACLMGSSNSPLVSKEAMQPWKPDLDSRGRGRFPYMFVLTPPEKDFSLL